MAFRGALKAFRVALLLHQVACLLHRVAPLPFQVACLLDQVACLLHQVALLLHQVDLKELPHDPPPRSGGVTREQGAGLWAGALSGAARARRWNAQQDPPASTRKKDSMSASVPMSPSPLKSAVPQVTQQLPPRQAKKASMSASVPRSPS